MRAGSGARISLVVMVVSIMSACGSEDSEPNPFSMTVTPAAENVQENSTLHVEVGTSGGAGDEYVNASVSGVTMNAGVPEVIYTDTGFYLNVGGVAYNEESYKVTVTGTKGNETIIEEFTVTASNRTGDLWRDRAVQMRRTAPAQRMFIAEMLMIEWLVKAVNLSGGNINMNDLRPDYIDAMHGDERFLNGMYAAITDVRNITQYDEGKMQWTESFGEFRQALSSDDCDPPFCVNDYLRRVEPLFSYIFDRSQGAIARPAYGDVQFDNKTNTYSIFYVAGENGDFDEHGNWSFKAELEYLSALILAGHAAALEFSAEEGRSETDEEV